MKLKIVNATFYTSLLKRTLILCFVAFSNSLQAQQLTQNIRGTVVDNASQIPIVGALVVVVGSSPLIGAATDSDGNFKLANVTVGRPVVQLSLIGYNPVKLSNLVLTSAKELVLNIPLEPNAITGKEVEIVAKIDKDKPLNEMSGVSARTFSVDEAQRYAGSFGDPARLATSFAGVVAGNDQRNDIVVRGNSPLGVLWRLEGVDIPSPSHYSGSGTSGGAVSILNTNVLANSDFASGAFAAEYGNATSAAFDVKMRNGNNEKREYTAQVGFNGFEFGAEGPFKKGKRASYMINYRYSTLGLFDAVGISFVEGGVPKYQDISMKLNFPHKKGVTSIFGIVGTSDIFFKGEKDSTLWKESPDDQQDLKNGSDMAVVGLNHVQFLNGKTTLKLSVAATGSKFRTTVDSITPNYAIIQQFNSRITEQKLFGSLVLNTKINNRSQVRAGLIVSRYFYNNSVSIFDRSLNNMRNLVAFNGNGDLIQGYGQWLYKAGKRWTFNAGLHTLHFYLNNKSSVEPRGSVKFQLSGNKSLSFGAGKHSRILPVNIYLRETLLPNGTSLQTNRNLDLLRSNHYVLAYDWLIKENLRLKTEIYYQEQYNVGIQQGRPSSLSLLNYGASFGDVIGPDSLLSKGKGTNKGIEVTLEKFFNKNYYFLLTTSLFDSKYKGSDGIERNTAFNSRYAFNLLAGKEIPVGKTKQNVIILSFRTVATGGNWISPIDLNASRNAGTEVRNEAAAGTVQLKSYYRTDIRIGFRKNKKKYTEEYGFDIQNVLNRQNIFSQLYNVSSGEIQNNYQVGFFPMALYRITF